MLSFSTRIVTAGQHLKRVPVTAGSQRKVVTRRHPSRAWGLQVVAKINPGFSSASTHVKWPPPLLISPDRRQGCPGNAAEREVGPLRFPEPLRVAVIIDRDASEPLHTQITRQIKHAIDTGALHPGHRLPSTRTLAEALSVSRSVVLAAFEELHAVGCLRTQPGSGTFVNRATGVTKVPPPRATERPAVPALQQSVGEAGTVDLTPGLPGNDGFPIAAWRAAWRRTTHTCPSAADQPTWDLRLRRAVTGHVRDVRALDSDEHNMIMANGVYSAIDLLTASHRSPGPRVVVEDPGDPQLWPLLIARGATVVPTAVDDEGLVTDDLPESADIVIVAPSHQFPTGARMSLRRRHELLAWARKSKVLVVELDRGSGFWHGTCPLPALYALRHAGDLVAYVDSLCLTFTPAVKLGYIVTERGLADRLRELSLQLTSGPSLLTTQGVTHLLEEGHVAAHLRRLQPMHREKRQMVIDVLGRLPGGARLEGLDAGAHAVLRLPPGVQADSAAEWLRSPRGVIVPPLTRYEYTARDHNGLVIGYLRPQVPALRRALSAVAEAVTTSLRQPAVSG